MKVHDSYYLSCECKFKLTELHYIRNIRYRHDVKPREHLTKTVKQSIYFYVYISYNKNISYIVTVTLKLPTPAVHESEEWAGRGGGVARGHRGGAGYSISTRVGREGRGRELFYTRNIKSHPIVSNVQFTKMRKFKSPSQCLTMDD